MSFRVSLGSSFTRASSRSSSACPLNAWRSCGPKDTGTLQYDTYFNDDQSECIVLERFRDSEALIEHAAHLGDLMEAILATGSVSGEFLGEPSAELRAKLAGSEVPVLFTPFQSM
ncbi:MAG TPA: hypothetical protein VGJ95_08600 [Pseudonocardiaceae bacterium]